MDCIKQLHRVGGLVALEAADRVKPQVTMLRQERRPLGESLLNPILTEIALTSSDQWLDFLDTAPFADGDQLHVGRVALGNRRDPGDLIEDPLSSFGGTAHAKAL
jgi:hypothetical protein